MRYLEFNLGRRPPGAFDQVEINGSKLATRLDVGAEEVMKATFWRFAGGALSDVDLFGEESLKDGLDLSAFARPVGLIDALDGTNNALHVQVNFASTGSVFDPSAPDGSKMIATAIVTPGGTGYLWDATANSVRVCEGRGIRPVKGTSGRTSLAGATLAVVAQKRDDVDFLCMLSHALGGDVLHYGIAGMPIVSKFIDLGLGGLGIDIIADQGQLAHDSAPLIFLALKAGAAVLTLDGIPLGEREVERALLHPGRARLAYVAAASRELAERAVTSLGEATHRRAA
jgi:fructose-1,6-bisphosphatase/inositol monophosphatase family enzyme